MRFSFYLLFASTVLFHSCRSGEAVDSEGSSADTLKTDQRAADPAHNSQNALDWKGTYVGMLPCDDCDELHVEVTLKVKERYSRKMTYRGKSKTPLLSSGKFEWNESGSEIVLKSFKGNNQSYKVGENKLTYQMPEGDSGDYFLTKIPENEAPV